MKQKIMTWQAIASAAFSWKFAVYSIISISSNICIPYKQPLKSNPNDVGQLQKLFDKALRQQWQGLFAHWLLAEAFAFLYYCDLE